MARHFYQKKSKLAVISRWVGIFCANLLLLTIALHRFADLSTPAAVNLIAVAFLGGGLALILSVFALVRIWYSGYAGGGAAVVGVLVGTIMFAAPAYYLPKLVALPKINDVTTDLKQPPGFQKVTLLRPVGTNSTRYRGAAFSENQLRAYPDIVPLNLERSYDVAFNIVKEAATDLGWEVVGTKTPKGRHAISGGGLFGKPTARLS